MQYFRVLSVFFLAASFLLPVPEAQAQELIYQINISAPKIQQVDPKVFRTLETNLTEFLNNRKWTDDVFTQEEKIKCNVQITIDEEISLTSFRGQIMIQASRPVYGTTYETTLFNHQDKDFIFNFDEAQPLIYTDNAFTENLTHVFAFYSYFILGLDYDSFSPYGGDRYFQIASEIVSSVPTTERTGQGWKSSDGSINRYWLSENIMSPRCRPFRRAFYDYHRLGLDMMHKDPEAARNVITKCMEELEKVNASYPNALILRTFSNAKAQEISDIYMVAPGPEKQKVYRILTRIDPSAVNKYSALRQ